MSMELLDRLDPRRFDADEIADLLNAFDDLTEVEQTEASLDGVDPALPRRVIDEPPVAPGPVRSH